MPRKYAEIGSETDRLFYAFSHATVMAVGRLALNFRVDGAENLPDEGSGLITCNHLHWSDVLFTPTAIPNRHVVVVGRRKYMEMPVVGSIFRRWGAVVIDRGRENPGREALLQAVETIKQPLKEGRLVLAFASPNTRTPGYKPGPTNGGIARAAYETSSAVYAAIIKGSDRLGDRRVAVSFSQSLGYPPSDSPKDRKEFLQQILEVQTEMFDSVPHHHDYQPSDLIK